MYDADLNLHSNNKTIEKARIFTNLKKHFSAHLTMLQASFFYGVSVCQSVCQTRAL